MDKLFSQFEKLNENHQKDIKRRNSNPSFLKTLFNLIRVFLKERK